MGSPPVISLTAWGHVSHLIPIEPHCWFYFVQVERLVYPICQTKTYSILSPDWWWMTWLSLTHSAVPRGARPPRSSVTHSCNGILWTLAPKGSLISSIAFCLHSQEASRRLHYPTLRNRVHYCNSAIMEVTSYCKWALDISRKTTRFLRWQGKIGGRVFKREARKVSEAAAVTDGCEEVSQPRSAAKCKQVASAWTVSACDPGPGEFTHAFTDTVGVRGRIAVGVFNKGRQHKKNVRK